MDTNEEKNTKKPDSPVEGGAESAVSQGRSLGPAVGIIIVVAILVLGGLYFWTNQTFTNNDATPSIEEIRGGNDSVTDRLEEQGTSDRVQDIENDLNTTDLESLDLDLSNIEAEFSL